VVRRIIFGERGDLPLDGIITTGFVGILSTLLLLTGLLFYNIVTANFNAQAAIDEASQSGVYYGFPYQAGQAETASNEAFQAQISQDANNMNCGQLSFGLPNGPQGTFTATVTCTIDVTKFAPGEHTTSTSSACGLLDGCVDLTRTYTASVQISQYNGQ